MASIRARRSGSPISSAREFLGSIDADTFFTSRNAKHPEVVHCIKKMRGCIRGSTPVIRNPPMREILIDLAWMYSPALINKLEKQLCAFSLFDGPRLSNIVCWNTRIRARMHQALQSPGDITVVDKEIFFDAKLLVTSLKVAGSVVVNTVAQDQVLALALVRESDRLEQIPFG